MPLSIPVFYKSKLFAICFSDDTLSRLSNKVKDLIPTTPTLTMYYKSSFSDLYRIDDFDKSHCNVVSYSTNKIVDTIQKDCLVSELKHIPLCFLAGPDVDMINVFDKRNCACANINDFVFDNQIESLKMDINTKYVGSENKSIHESIFFKELVLKIAIKETIDKKVLTNLWNNFDLRHPFAVMKRIIRKGKREHTKELKIIKDNTLRREQLKEWFASNELQEITVEANKEKEFIYLYMQNKLDPSTYDLITLEENGDMLFFSNGHKPSHVKNEFPSDNNGLLWGKYFDQTCFDFLNEYLKFNINDQSQELVTIKKATVNYDAFITIHDLHKSMASQKWFEFFYQQSVDESCSSIDESDINTFYYHPYHKSKRDFKISATVQQMYQKNCIRFTFNISEDTNWYVS